MAQFNAQNERNKRQFLQWLKEAEGKDEKTLDIVAAAIRDFEMALGCKPFGAFHRDWARRYKSHLERARHHRTGKPLSLTTRDARLRHVKAFFKWLASQPGYKSRISFADVEYFNNNAKDARAAHARRPERIPSMEQCAHAFRNMPEGTDIEKRDNPNYCHRVTADDGAVGEQHLRDFQDNDKTIPTILTTSQKLSTGVDARNIRHIVLMRPIRSMIEFKQIIGRGTRTYEGKDFFTIWDFVKAHENFNDPEWDGEPLEPEEPKGPRTPPTGPEPGPEEPPGGGEGPEPPQEKIVVNLSDGSVRRIKYIASTTYWSPEGKPISAQEFLERLFGDLAGIVADEDQLRAVWSDPDNRERFLEQLSDRGYDRDRLDDIRRLVDASDSDLFDVLGSRPINRLEAVLAA